MTKIRFKKSQNILLHYLREYLKRAAIPKIDELSHLSLEDHHRIFMEVCKHWVSEGFYHGLKNIKGVNEILPNEILEKLKNNYEMTLCRNTLLFYELENLLKWIHATGAQVIILKGAALSQTVYSNIALRAFGDIDLLAQPNDWPKLKNALRELGFTPDRNYDELTEQDVWDYTCSFRTLNFRKTDPLPIHLDIHFNSVHLGWSKAESHQLWSRALEIKMPNAAALGLCPEDLLVHLCIHLTFHNFGKLQWFVDIYKTIQYYNETLDWNQLINESKGKGRILPLYYGLSYTKRLLDCPIPSWVLEELKPNLFLRKQFEFNWHQKEILQLKPKSHATFGLVWLMTEGFWDKLKYIFQTVFPPISWLRCHYSLPRAKKNYLYYFQHFVNLLRAKL